MQDNAYDHLIIGSTPLAGLTAGLLAREHGKRVCLVAEPFSAFALERRFDLTLDLVTRPETLVLLKRVAAETLKLIAGIGRNLTDRVDPLFIAETRGSIAALGHFQHLAQALDIAAERSADRAISAGSILRLRGQHLIAHARFAPALDAWLAAAEVRRLDPAATGITLRKDGTARIAASGFEVEAAHVLLADDEAVQAHLRPDAWDRAIVRVPGIALLLQPAKPVPHPLGVWLDRGLTLRQAPKGPLAAVATGARDTAEARLASATTGSLPLRRAGAARFDALATSDGAPILAPGRGTRVLHLAGFRRAAAFYAPALARQLAGVASADEAAWFAARGATRGNLRLNAAEFNAAEFA